MKKANNHFSLDALASKTKLNKVEMQTIKGGFSCYCNGHYSGDSSSLGGCYSTC